MLNKEQSLHEMMVTAAHVLSREQSNRWRDESSCAQKESSGGTTGVVCWEVGKEGTGRMGREGEGQQGMCLEREIRG